MKYLIFFLKKKLYFIDVWKIQLGLVVLHKSYT